MRGSKCAVRGETWQIGQNLSGMSSHNNRSLANQVITLDSPDIRHPVKRHAGVQVVDEVVVLTQQSDGQQRME